MNRNRSEAERIDPHPVFAAFQNHAESRASSNDRVRHTAVPVYIGLIKQIDDEIGRLRDFLRQTGRLDSTMVASCLDHGDCLGNH